MKKLRDKGGLISAFINPTASGSLEFFDKACLLWNEDGRIEYFSHEMPKPDRIHGYHMLLRENMIAIPGLIDLHTHLPQYEFAGQGAEALLPWLEKYTFPQEARFADDRIAEAQSQNFFKNAVASGTTTVVAYLSSFVNAGEIAFHEAEKCGIRGYLGLTLMDRNVPASLLTNAKKAEQDMIALIEKFHKKSKNEFVVTPRFAISCTSPLLSLCGEIASAHDAVLQTHISENVDEIKSTAALFPESKSYADVYDRHGCLTRKTLLGHGIHLSGDERKLIKEKQSVVVHCPVSNNFLASGIMPYKNYYSEGIKLGLGTDVAAGYSLSMLHEAKHMVEMSKLLSPGSALSVDRALWQATLGNAAALGRAHDLGSFAIGKQADIALIEDSRAETMLGREKNQYRSLAERLNRVLYRGTHSMVERTLVDGEAVFVR